MEWASGLIHPSARRCKRPAVHVNIGLYCTNSLLQSEFWNNDSAALQRGEERRGKKRREEDRGSGSQALTGMYWSAGMCSTGSDR